MRIERTIAERPCSPSGSPRCSTHRRRACSIRWKRTATPGSTVTWFSTTPSGALVSFQSLVNAGVGLPMTIDSDTSTPGYQCPSGMEEVTEARGRMPLGVTPTGTLGGETGDEYTDTDIARRGGTAQSISGSATTSVGSHTHDEWGVGGSVGVIGGNTGIFAQEFGEGTTGETTPSASTSVSVTDYTDKPHPAPALQVLWCRFS